MEGNKIFPNSYVLSMDTLELVVTLLSPKPSFHSSDHDRMKKALDILSEFWACRKRVLHFCSGSKAQHAGMAVPLRQEPRKPAPRSESTGYCAIGWERPQTGERKWKKSWRGFGRWVTLTSPLKSRAEQGLCTSAAAQKAGLVFPANSDVLHQV